MRKAAGMWILLGLSLALWVGCGQQKEPEEQREQEYTAGAEESEGEKPLIGLVLTSQDGRDNEEITEAFADAAKAAGAELRVKIPEVTEAAAREAYAITGDFILYEVDPIEHQMLCVNELVAEGAEVIAIDANHRDALEPVLAAARAVGIRVCAFGSEVNENCRDVYAAEIEEAAEASVDLLEE